MRRFALKNSSGLTTASSFFNSVRKHLTLSAAAAVVVGVSALTLPSEAKVVYTPANVVIGGQGYNFDLNNDGVTDFTIQTVGKFTSRCQLYDYVDEGSAPGNGVVPYYNVNGEWAAALTQGATIGSGPRYEGSLASMAFYAVNCPHVASEGPWMNVIQHYLGLRFQVNGQTHYGWARLSVLLHCGRGGGCTFVVTLTGYAYETIAGKSINAGQTSGG